MSDASSDPGLSREGRDGLLVATLVLFFVLMDIAFLYEPYGFINRDGRFYINTNEALVEHHTLDQHRFASSWYDGKLGWNHNLDPAWSNVALGRNGNYWPKHPLLLPVLATPFFYAFGLNGALLFNLLMFAAAACGGYGYARRYVRPSFAALAIGAFLLGTSVREHAYDYHLDVLMLAMLLVALSLLRSKRGAAAGVLCAMTIVMRPTSVLFLWPCLAVVWEQRDRRTFLRACVGGAVTLMLAGAVNAWMYGSPFWIGYNRTLVIVNGVPQVASHTDAFGVPFDQGLRRMWSGGWGLRHRMTILVLALPGWCLLVRRRPAYGAAALVSLALAVLVFAKYQYEGDRFLWLAFAAFLPSLGAALGALGSVSVWIRTKVSRKEPTPSSERLVARIATAGLASVCTAAPLLFAPSASAKLGAHDWNYAATLASHGAASTALLFIVHLACVVVVSVCVFSLLEFRLPLPGVCFVAFSVTQTPLTRDVWLQGGPLVFSTVLLLAAAALANVGRWKCAFALLLAGLGMLVGGYALLSQQMPPTFVDFARGLRSHVPNVARSAWPPLIVAPVGLVIAFRVRPALAAVLAGLIATAFVPALGAAGSLWPLSAIVAGLVCGAFALECVVRLSYRLAARSSRRLRIAAVCLTILALFGIGGVRRAIAAHQPFRLASERAVKNMTVFLGEIPCDFFKWESLSWECSHFDHDAYHMVGLALPEGVSVGGTPSEMVAVPTGWAGEKRSATWQMLRRGSTFVLRYAVPDGRPGGVHVRVYFDDVLSTEFDMPSASSGHVLERLVRPPTSGRRETQLRIEVQSIGSAHYGAIAVDGRWQ